MRRHGRKTSGLRQLLRAALAISIFAAVLVSTPIATAQELAGEVAAEILLPEPIAGEVCADVTFGGQVLTGFQGADSRRGATYAIIPDGEYRVVLTSSDETHGLEDEVDQPNESWVLEGLDAAGEVVFETEPTLDLPFGTELIETDAGEVTAAGVVSLRPRHAADSSAPNSVLPARARFISEECLVPGELMSLDFITGGESKVDPFICNRRSSIFATVSGFAAGEAVTIEFNGAGSPTMREADADGTVPLRWICPPGADVVDFLLTGVTGRMIDFQLFTADFVSEAPPESVRNFVIQATSTPSNSLRAVWSIPDSHDGIIQSYEVSIGGEVVANVGPLTTSWLAEDLSANTIFQIGVTAIDINGTASEQALASASTEAEEALSPGSPPSAEAIPASERIAQSQSLEAVRNGNTTTGRFALRGTNEIIGQVELRTTQDSSFRSQTEVRLRDAEGNTLAREFTPRTSGDFVIFPNYEVDIDSLPANQDGDVVVTIVVSACVERDPITTPERLSGFLPLVCTDAKPLDFILEEATNFVVLGDSYSAGVGGEGTYTTQLAAFGVDFQTRNCRRSENAWGEVVAEELGWRLTNLACLGDDIDDLKEVITDPAGRQVVRFTDTPFDDDGAFRGTIELSELTQTVFESADVIGLTIGGNEETSFSTIAKQCLFPVTESSIIDEFTPDLVVPAADNVECFEAIDVAETLLGLRQQEGFFSTLDTSLREEVERFSETPGLSFFNRTDLTDEELVRFVDTNKQFLTDQQRAVLALEGDRPDLTDEEFAAGTDSSLIRADYFDILGNLVTKAPDAQIILMGYPRLTSPMCGQVDVRIENRLATLEIEFERLLREIVSDFQQTEPGGERVRFQPTSEGFLTQGPCSRNNLIHLINTSGFVGFNPVVDSYHPTTAGHARLAEAFMDGNLDFLAG